MTVAEALKQSEQLFRRAKIDSFRIDSLILLEHVTGQSRAHLIAHPEMEVDNTLAKHFLDLVMMRRERLPMAQVLGSWEFYGLKLEVSNATLTPRVETEKMVEWAIKHAPKESSLIDIGTGTGAIAVAVKYHRPDLTVTATEVSAKALAVARRNATKHAVDIQFIESDLWNGIVENFAIVCTNLPYLKDDADLMPEVTKEPAVALFGGPDGLGLYRRFLASLPQHLEPHGFLFTECDPWQQPDLITETAKYGLSPIEQGYFILGFQHKK